MGNKLYIVAELGYEYDDNNYYRGEGSGSIPRTAYRTEEKARKVCDELNLEEFKNLFDNRDIFNYGDIDWILRNDDNTEALFSKYFGSTVDNWFSDADVDWVIKPTDEDYKNLYDCFNISWFTVTSVLMED